jgi:CBS domain-containing protein
MEVKNIMSHHVRVVGKTATIKEVAKKMRDLDLGAIPVLDNGQTIGIVTDRDITIRAVAAGLDPATTQITAIMSSPVVSCFADQEVDEAAAIMEKEGIRRLVVLTRDGHLAGILSLDDLVVADLGEKRLAGEVLDAVAERTKLEIEERAQTPPEQDLWV